jgi:hypothetical protein
MLKKLTMLAMAVGAFAAFAVPATASADVWNEPGEYHFEGHLNATVPALGLEFTCDVTAVVHAENTPTATGQVTELNALTGNPNCHMVQPASATTCTITGAVLGAGGIVAATGETGVQIAEASFLNELEGCKVTPIAEAKGTATGTWNNNGSCIEFNKDPHLVTTLPITGLALELDGKLCTTEGEELLLEAGA